MASPHTAGRPIQASSAEALAGTLPPLVVDAERVASAVAQGVHGRRRTGQGETFWQFRRYRWGDQPQAIDWRRSARSDRLYIRETEWEAAQSIWLWRDCSPSMQYRSADNPPKVDRADLLLLALCALLVRGGERVGLLAEHNPPTSGRAVVNRLAVSLAHERKPGGPVAASAPPSRTLPRFGTVALFGDFLAPPEETVSVVMQLASQGVVGHLLQVLDPAEASMPFRGRTRFEGLENEGELLVGRAEGLRQQYLNRLADHQRALRDGVTAAGWTIATHHTDQSPESALLALYVVLSDQLTGT